SGARCDGPGAALAVIEGDQLLHIEEVRLRKERVGTQALGKPLRPGRRRPAQVADESAAEGRQRVGALAFDGPERLAERLERALGQVGEPSQRVRPPAADGEPRRRLAPAAALAATAYSHVAIAAKRALEEEGVAAGGLLLVEEAEDAERRQQITGQLDCGRAAPKDGSGAGCPWRGL